MNRHIQSPLSALDVILARRSVREYTPKRIDETTLRSLLDADEVRLVQVLSYLVDNAVRFTPNAGHIDVAVTTGGAEILIVVQDDGAGIPPEHVDNIFEPSVQLSEPRPAARGGMALGRRLVRRWTERHGGTVDVSSGGRNCGSRLAVHLPLQCPVHPRLLVPTCTPN